MRVGLYMLILDRPMVVVLDGGWRVKAESRVSTESLDARQTMHRGQGYIP